ncbi:hypothetical protein BJX65DRAFT_265496 [Aspergillus insuetus]
MKTQKSMQNRGKDAAIYTRKRSPQRLEKEMQFWLWGLQCCPSEKRRGERIMESQSRFFRAAVVVSQASTDPQPCLRNAGKGTLKVDGAVIDSAVNWPVPSVAKASAPERARTVPTKALPSARLWAAADVSRAGLDDRRGAGQPGASNEKHRL